MATYVEFIAQLSQRKARITQIDGLVNAQWDVIEAAYAIVNPLLDEQNRLKSEVTGLQSLFQAALQACVALEPSATTFSQIGACIDEHPPDIAAFLPVPVAPTNLVATPGDSQVTLTWDPVNTATMYTIRESTTPGGPYSDIQTVNTNSFVHTGLENGITYYYVVAAGSPSGTGPDSAEVSAAPTAP